MKHIKLFEAFTSTLSEAKKVSPAEFKKLFDALKELTNITKLKKGSKGAITFTAPDGDPYTVKHEEGDIMVYNDQYLIWKDEYAEEVGGISTDDFEDMEIELDSTDSAEWLDFQEAVDFIAALK